MPLLSNPPNMFVPPKSKQWPIGIPPPRSIALRKTFPIPLQTATKFPRHALWCTWNPCKSCTLHRCELIMVLTHLLEWQQCDMLMTPPCNLSCPQKHKIAITCWCSNSSTWLQHWSWSSENFTTPTFLFGFNCARPSQAHCSWSITASPLPRFWMFAALRDRHWIDDDKDHGNNNSNQEVILQCWDLTVLLTFSMFLL